MLLLVFRDDEAARAQYLAALERKAAYVETLEQRIRELEAENRELRASVKSSRPPPAPAVGSDDIYVDDKVHGYAAALVAATDPSRTEGILSGARMSDAHLLIAAACTRARTENRRYVIPEDVRRCALEVLPAKLLMKDPDADPHSIVRAILSVVDVPLH